MRFKDVLLSSVVAVLLTVVCATTAQAAVTHIISGGKLTGATDIDVSGTLYNVTFVDDAYINFNTKPYTFPTWLNEQSEAEAFANALLDQVFLDVKVNGDNYAFDNNPALTFGCDVSVCESHIAYQVFGEVPFTVYAENTDFFGSGDGVSTSSWHEQENLANESTANWAVFSQASVAAVPEPSSYAMLLAGLGLLGFAKRRQQSNH